MIDVKVNHVETAERSRAGSARRSGPGPRARGMDPPGLRLLDAEAVGRGSEDRGPGEGARPLPGSSHGMKTWLDRTTGATRNAGHRRPAISHPTYFLQSSFFPGGRQLVLSRPYRTGAAQLFEISLDTGESPAAHHRTADSSVQPALHPDGRTAGRHPRRRPVGDRPADAIGAADR